MACCCKFQALVTVTAFLCCVLALRAVGEIMPAHSAIVGLVQSIQDPRYKVELHPPGASFQKDPEQETVVMTGADGRKYECVLPQSDDKTIVKDQPSEQNSSSVSLTIDRRNPKTPDNLLSILKGQCFGRHEGWWTYEFCYQGKLRQVHVEKTKVVQEYDLGTYDADDTDSLHQSNPDVLLQKDHRSKSAAQRYYSHLHTNGTLCDLTNEPRQTEVRFVCADTGNNMINAITEASTCKYILVFHAPALCKHPSFQEERPQSLIINCLELPPADDDDAVDIKDEDIEVLEETGDFPSAQSSDELL